MPELLQQEWGNNRILDYVFVASALLVALLFKRLISKNLARWMFRVFGPPNKKTGREAFLALVVPPLDFCLLLLVSLVACEKLNIPDFLQFKIYKVAFPAMLEALANGVMIAAFIWLCVRLIDFTALLLEEKANQTPDQTDNQLILFFKDFLKVILVITGVLLILRFSFHRDVSSLLTSLSIIGAAIALATRESMENLIASFIIFFDRPFVTGDLVKVNGFTGTIERIGLRSTRIRTQEKTYLSVPNKQMVDTIVDNLSLRSYRKAELRLEIDLAAPPAALQNCLAAMRQYLHQPQLEEVQVHLTDTGKGAHVVQIEYLVDMHADLASFLAQRETHWLALLNILAQHQLALAEKKS